MKIEKKLPKGVKKHIRREKRKLRKAGLAATDKANRVQEIYANFKKRFIKVG